MTTSTDRTLFEKYLSILGCARKEPSLPALRELVEAQLTRVPFESLSKIYYKKHEGLTALPGLERYLEGIERFGFGGTCYANNIYLNALLTHLGYDAKLCGADMSQPDVHIVNIIRLNGREYIVDAGYAAPFLEPLPRDLTTDYVVELGRDRYVLHPQDGNGCSRVDLHREGQLIHGYLAKPDRRTTDEFKLVIADSFREDATFMNAILLTRFSQNESLVIHNLMIVESLGSEWKTKSLENETELAKFVEARVGIAAAVVLEIIEELGELKDPWS